MMGAVFCEVCGKEIPTRNPEGLIAWNHNHARRPVTCIDHHWVRRYKHAKMLIYNPRTGERKDGINHV